MTGESKQTKIGSVYIDSSSKVTKIPQNSALQLNSFFSHRLLALALYLHFLVIFYQNY